MNNRGEVSCRSCHSLLGEVVLSLGDQPLSNALPLQNYQGIDAKFPLDFRVCSICSLGQIGEFVSPEGIFSEYTYFSSTSSTWLEHASKYSKSATEKLDLNPGDLVVEIASNDGYLLQYFQELGCKVLGIEPARNVADFANNKGIPTRVVFFGLEAAQNLVEGREIPKLVVANNVLAHVPDINDFMSGIALLASHGATISIEAPSMLVMLRDNLFDTIYHEHFSYLSVSSVEYLINRHGLQLFEVESLPSHGGSTRYWLRADHSIAHSSVEIFKNAENDFGISKASTLQEFALKSSKAIEAFSDWVSQQNLPIVGYGAAAKATVLLNAAKISRDQILGIADKSVSKQGRYVPGCRIPIFSPDEIIRRAKGNLIIFPWNIASEIRDLIKQEFTEFRNEIWVPLPELKRLS
jgi:hypothetical protein